MKTCLSHFTALGYWREHFPLDSELGAPARVSGIEHCAACKADVLGSIPEEFIESGRPVDVLVFDERDRRRSSSIKCHVWNTALPPQAFYRARGVYVSSPEFLFLQMANVLPLSQLIALGCELCGRYVLMPRSVRNANDLDEYPMRLTPLTSKQSLADFLNNIGKANGKSKAKRALKYVVDGSRSPMETLVYMLLCLSVMLGGYGLSKPVMNAKIDLDDEGRAIAQRRRCYGDLCWPDAKPPLDVEYHGGVHIGKANMESDVGRELGIEHMGWRVITITSPQVFDPDRFEVVAKEVASAIGKYLAKDVLENDSRRIALRQEMSQWMFGK